MSSIVRITAVSILAVASVAACAQSSQSEQDSRIRLNQIQVIGSHNSYHAGFAPSEAKLMQQRNPRAFDALDYSHPPLDQQLSAGIRQIELDIYADAHGGRFAHPAITTMTAEAHLPPDPPLDPDHQLDKPGFKIMHVVGIDQRSTCPTLIACLTTVRTWSSAHPQHLPIFILIETKQDKSNEKPKPYAVPTEPFTASVFDELDAKIRSVFSASEMITPDQVRGSYATLPEAIANGGWPTLAQARGKVIFLLDQSSVTPIYTAAHPALRGRVLFTNAVPGSPDAAFVEQNEGSPTAIDALVKQGYLVRTRTDEPTADARTNNVAKRDRALSSHAQMLSTDYPASEPARWPGHYSVAFPRGVIARCNLVPVGTSCDDGLLEPASETAK